MVQAIQTLLVSNDFNIIVRIKIKIKKKKSGKPKIKVNGDDVKMLHFIYCYNNVKKVGDLWWAVTILF